MTETIDTVIALEAKDLLPETWKALADADSFGPAALERRHNAVIQHTFGILLEEIDIEVLSFRVVEYLGKRLAYTLLDPGIDYWSRQLLSRTIGDREATTYKDRAEDLRQLKKEWAAELAAMMVDIGPLLPLVPGRAGDAPRVAQAGALTSTADNPRVNGDRVLHTSAHPYDLEPAYGLPEDQV